MASLSEVFNLEVNRKEPKEWNKIHLFKMGDFWRVYEWSAWLISVITYNDEVRMATKDRRPLQVTRMNRTDIEDTYCFVGFPIRSLEKYIPTRENFEGIDDKHVVVTITLPKTKDGSEITYERLSDAFNKWKDSIEIKQKKNKTENQPAAAAVPAAPAPGCGILSQIMAYPLSERTAIENIQFIQSLKQQLSAIL